MPNCRKCGEEISDFQYENFDGFCPPCKRQSSLGRDMYEAGSPYFMNWIHPFVFTMGGSGLTIMGIYLIVISLSEVSLLNHQGLSTMSLIGIVQVITGPIFLIIGIYLFLREKKKGA